MRAYVNEEVCQGHTLCHMAAPELFDLRDEDGHAFARLSQFTPEQFEAAKRAALSCPEQAIVIEE